MTISALRICYVPRGGGAFFSNRLCNRNTVEFLGIWEQLNNPNSNCAEFDKIRSQAELNSFLVFRRVPSIKSIASWLSEVSDKQKIEKDSRPRPRMNKKQEKLAVRGLGLAENRKKQSSEASGE